MTTHRTGSTRIGLNHPGLKATIHLSDGAYEGRRPQSTVGEGRGPWTSAKHEHIHQTSGRRIGGARTSAPTVDAVPTPFRFQTGGF